jgi:hypothetical protein
VRLPLKIAAGLALVAALPLLMAPTGGIPSYLTLLGLGAGCSAAPATGWKVCDQGGSNTWNAHLGSGQSQVFLISETSPGAPVTTFEADSIATNYWTNFAPAGNASILMLDGNGGSQGSSDFELIQDGTSNAILNNFANASMTFSTHNVARLAIDGSGNITAPNAISSPWPVYGDATVNTQPRTLAGRFNGTAGGCTITNSSGGFSGCSGSTGLYTITFSHTFSAAPACTASNENGTNTSQANVSPGIATSQVAVALVTSAGANTTGNFDVICVGK